MSDRRTDSLRPAGTVAPGVPPPPYVAPDLRDPLVGPMAIPFRWRAIESVPAGYPLHTTQQFAPGHAPAGGHMVVTHNGRPLQVQQHAESTWLQDGSYRNVPWCITTPAALAAGETLSLVIGWQPGAPNRTPKVSAAGFVAETDIEVRFSGGDLEAETYTASLTRIVRTYADTAWGANPLGGWRRVGGGPTMDAFYAWEFVKRHGDGAAHRRLKCEIYARRWSADRIEVGCRFLLDGAYGDMPGAPAGRTDRRRIACVAELFVDGVRRFAWGGENDTRAVTLPPSAFDAAANRVTLPEAAFTDDTTGYGLAVTFAGPNVPADIREGEVYWLYGERRDIQLYRFREMAFAQKNAAAAETRSTYGFGSRLRKGNTDYAVTNPGGSGRLPSEESLNGRGPFTFGTARFEYATEIFGRAPARPVKLAPLMHVVAGTAYDAVAFDGYRVWLSGSPRRRILPAHDEKYLLYRSRAVLPYNEDAGRYPKNRASLRPYSPGVTTGEIYGWSGTSDDVMTNRLGAMPNEGVAAFMVPFDETNDQRTRIAAFRVSGIRMWRRDPRSGRAVNVVNQAYPGMAPPNVTFETHGNNAKGTPAWGRDTEEPAGRLYDGDATGEGSYGNLIDDAHLQLHWIAPYIRTGDEMFLDHGVALGLATLYGAGQGRNAAFRNPTLNISAAMVGQRRGVAWATHCLATAHGLLPADAPERPMLRDVVANTFGFLLRSLQDSRCFHLGMHHSAEQGGAGQSVNRPYMNSFVLMTFGLVAWGGEFPACGEYLYHMLRWERGIYGSPGSPLIMEVDNIRPDEGGVWPDFETVLARRLPQVALPGKPGTVAHIEQQNHNYFLDTDRFFDSTSYPVIKHSGYIMCAKAKVPGALALMRRWDEWITTRPMAGRPSGSGPSPQGGNNFVDSRDGGTWMAMRYSLKYVA